MTSRRPGVVNRYRVATRPRCEESVTARTSRRAARTAAGLLTTASVLVLTAAPALALDDGEEPADPLPLGTSLLLLLVVPLLIMVLTALPIFAAARRKSRYRPAEGWNHQPMWFAGPADPEAAVSAASPDQPGRGGASATW